MSSDSNSLLLDEVNTWNVNALRLFCRKRNLEVSGNRAELVARVFAASEMGIAVQPSANELITRTETEKAGRFATSRFAPNRSRFTAHVKSIRYNLMILEVVSLKNTIMYKLA